MSKFGSGTNAPPMLSQKDLAALHRELPSSVSSYLWNPVDMVKTVTEAKLASERLATLDTPSREGEIIDWKGIIAEDGGLGESLHDALQAINGLHKAYSDLWLEVIANLYLQHNGQEFDFDSLTDEDDSIYEDFMRAPNENDASKHPLLKHLPNIAERVRSSQQECNYWFLKQSLEYHHRPTVLWAEICTPSHWRQQPKTLEVWMHIAADTNNIESDDPWVFEFSTVLVERKDRGRASLVAAMCGHYIPGYRNNTLLGDGFFDVMDAHSAMLNDVWKAVIGDFLPKNGFADMDDFAEYCNSYNSAFIAPGIAVPSLYVTPVYRGQRIAEMLLQCAHELTEGAQFSNYLNHQNVRGGYTGDDYDELEEEGFETSPINLFVLAIEGTRPSEVLLAMPWMAGNLRKLGPPSNLDPIKERRREKLLSYFDGMDSEDNPFRLQCYNPWDYPVT